jgi:hypothetical protein
MYIVIGYNDGEPTYYGPFANREDAEKNIELGTGYCGCDKHEIRMLTSVIGAIDNATR